MILSDGGIRAALDSGRIAVEPLGDDAVQPASLDVRMGHGFRVFANHRHTFIDVRAPQPDLTDLVEVADDEAFVLHPGEFVLGSTLERITLGADVVARLDGKSSLGRLGLLIHSTAGIIDPGFSGTITLELSNVSTLPIAMYAGMKIGQFVFEELDAPAQRPYGSPGLNSKYQNQSGPTPSQMHRNF